MSPLSVSTVHMYFMCYRWLDVPADTQLDDLLDTQGMKKGISKAPVAGPIKLATGLHADKRPLSVTVQVCFSCLRSSTPNMTSCEACEVLSSQQPVSHHDACITL
jgi:hypothetical protein